MTPAARIAAAIGILDQILDQKPAEMALKSWARKSRFAGSKDRAAIRDLVFDGLRSRRSLAAWGDGDDGRAIMIGRLLRDGLDPADHLTGDGYAADPLSAKELEQASNPRTPVGAEACDIPDWLWPMWQADIGAQAVSAAKSQQIRAAVFLRVNLRKASVSDAVLKLAAHGIVAEPVNEVKTALKVTENERKIRLSEAYTSGLVELQDTASQRAIAALPFSGGMQVLDFCAGGGGKSLAIADAADVRVTAHDIAPQRMNDLPERAARAGVDIQISQSGDLNGTFDLVLCDAPCSGSGTWRRNPEAKWRLDDARLAALNATQLEVLESGAALTAADGVLAYATCSVLACENQDAVAAFCNRNPDWSAHEALCLLPTQAHDGFYLALLSRTKNP